MEFKPLTIFIGPNNSGKSYMALLAYALAGAAVGEWRFQYPRRFPVGFPRRETEVSAGALDAFDEYLAAHGGRPFGAVLQLSEFPEPAREAAVGLLRAELDAWKSDVESVLRDCFAYEEPRSLVRAAAGHQQARIWLDGMAEHPLLAADLSEDRLEWTGQLPDLDSLRVSPDAPDFANALNAVGRMPRPGRDLPLAFDALAHLFWRRILEEQGFPPGQAYYLPPARSGLLQGWQLSASMAIRSLRTRWGLERTDVPALTGVAADFLQLLLERVLAEPAGQRGEGREAMRPALDFLEGKVLQGGVSIEGVEAGLPRMVYRTNELELPVQRASSMVAELAPLDLWINQLVRPGDLFIVDEPEAHLHPASQRMIARVLVRLARAGVRVVCPTHSSLILHQVSNHLLASDANAASRRKQGFTKDDVLLPDDVAVYLFRMDGGATTIEPVPIEPGFGIAEDEFVRVAEAIGDETSRLASAVAGR